MAKGFTHLTLEERNWIRILRLLGVSLRGIARFLDRSPSTISEEIARHKHHNGYEPIRAHGHAKVVRKKPRKPHKMDNQVIETYVKKGLRQFWSPEQIAGRMRLDYPDSPEMRISPECIYQWIAEDKARGGKWYTYLRINNKKRRYYRVKGSRRNNIANRKWIEERPASVDTRQRYGDWEADTVEGAPQKGRIATLVERKTFYTLIAKMDSKHARCFNDVLLERIDGTHLPMRTITADNGAEFAGHKELEEHIQAKVYFAQPYCPWQRGLNENTNRLIRQYFPKKTDFTLVTKEQVALIENALNNRPRKKLAYRTPAEAMATYLISRTDRIVS